jgi:hypothetical protein
MINFEIKKSNILDSKSDLIILPLYLTNKLVSDPIISKLISLKSFSNKKDTILDINIGAGKKIELYNSASDTTFWLYTIKTGMNQGIGSLVTTIQGDILSTRFKSISISQIGITEYDFNENYVLNLQKKKWEEFSSNHKDLKINLILLEDDLRPVEGKHLFSDEIINDGKPDIGKEKKKSRKTVFIDERKIDNYLDYFDQYIKLRTLNNDFISCSLNTSYIKDLKTFLKIITSDFKTVTNKRLNYSKWSKTFKEQTYKYYCQAPYKQTLKYIVLVLDMSEEEAKACFNFFGYGLARFNREDAQFLRILRCWSSYDITKIDAILKQYFGKKASLYYTGK